jgi:hypothetical protein
MVKGELTEQKVREVFGMLDIPNDGDDVGTRSLTLNEILNNENSLVPDSLLAVIKRELQVGAAGETTGLNAGVALDDVEGDPAALLSFDEICAFTDFIVTKPQIEKSLCAKLDAAEKSEAKGNLKTRNNQLGAYQNEVRAQAGKGVPAQNAPHLNILGEVLKAESP